MKNLSLALLLSAAFVATPAFAQNYNPSPYSSVPTVQPYQQPVYQPAPQPTYQPQPVYQPQQPSGGTDLRGPDLRGPDLRGPDLRGPDLR